MRNSVTYFLVVFILRGLHHPLPKSDSGTRTSSHSTRAQWTHSRTPLLALEETQSEHNRMFHSSIKLHTNACDTWQSESNTDGTEHL